jgi:hypothetical protein
MQHHLLKYNNSNVSNAGATHPELMRLRKDLPLNGETAFADAAAVRCLVF